VGFLPWSGGYRPAMSTHDEERPADDTPHDESAGLHVADSGGDGRPVVLIHGWPLSGESWAEQLAPLRDAGYRVVVYDRRGFGRSDPGDGYDYDHLAGDLDNVLTDLDLRDVTLVGFSMGGGEVARYVSAYGEDRLHSVVFAAAVTPYLAKTEDHPDGPLDEETAKGMEQGLRDDREAFFDQFTRQFFSAGDELAVSEEQRQQAIELCRQADQDAALGCMTSFATTDFRSDLAKISVPALIIHGDSDGVVPLEGSGRLTHEALSQSELEVIEGGPHGINTSHASQFNRILMEFLEH
jgi:non-heme chloroperoxidase